MTAMRAVVPTCRTTAAAGQQVVNEKAAQISDLLSKYSENKDCSPKAWDFLLYSIYVSLILIKWIVLRGCSIKCSLVYGPLNVITNHLFLLWVCCSLLAMVDSAKLGSVPNAASGHFGRNQTEVTSNAIGWKDFQNWVCIPDLWGEDRYT